MSREEHRPEGGEGGTLAIWEDPFTGLRFAVGDDSAQAALKAIASKLGNGLRADEIALFWRGYYESTFPVRFDSEGLVRWEERGDQLVAIRSDTKLIPAQGLVRNSKAEELLQDRLLTNSALVCLAFDDFRESDPDLVEALRLGTLTAPLKMQRQGLAEQVAAWWCGGQAAGLPEPVAERLEWIAHQCPAKDGAPRGALLVGSATRIQAYVYETAGLKEIRGGSQLLDESCGLWVEALQKELGPELVVRCAASTVEVLLPPRKLTDCLADFCEHVNDRVGLGIAGAGGCTFELEDLCTNYKAVVGQAHQEAERQKQNLPPRWPEVIPFASRCQFCGIRAAGGFVQGPEHQPIEVCEVCATKREWGASIRRRQIRRFTDLPPPEDLGAIVPSDTRYKTIAVVYGDGNNFGGVVQNRLTTLAHALQFTHRVERVTEEAVRVSLKRSMKECGKEFTTAPFEVLALGGDDLCLVTWGGIGLRFVNAFLEMTDLEFATSTERASERISYSFGLVVSSHSSPIRRLVECAHDQLLKGWAKKARDRKAGGNVAYIVTQTAEQVPGNLDDYREDYLTAGKGLALSLRPYSAAELSELLRMADEVRDEPGVLQRLVEGLLAGSALESELFYLYQRARLQKRDGPAGRLFQALHRGQSFPALGIHQLPWDTPKGRKLWGVKEADNHRYTPLWDVLEIVKLEK